MPNYDVESTGRETRSPEGGRPAPVGPRAVDIGDPDTEREIEVLPLEEPVPAPAPAQEPAEEPVPGG